MFHGMNPIVTGIFELEMEAQRQGIPEEERCWNCDGRGQIRSYTLMHAIYTVCRKCSGTGKRNKDLEKSLEEQEKLRKQE